MKRAEVFKFLFKWAWAIVAACVAVLSVIVLLIYTQAEPENVSELLDKNDSWVWTKTLSETPGDLEVYPYVTKVYSYGTNSESLDISYVHNQKYSRGITHGIIQDEKAEFNYYVECFVYSELADKELMKNTWGMIVNEGDELTFTRTEAPYIVCSRYDGIGDIKKESSRYIWEYFTFMRITVKPGYADVNFTDIGDKYQ